MKKSKPEICQHCGQLIDKDIYWKHMEKRMKQEGLPSFAKIVSKIRKWRLIK